MTFTESTYDFEKSVDAPWWIKILFLFCRTKYHREENVTLTYKKCHGYTLITGCYSFYGPFVIGPIEIERQGNEKDV